MVEKPPFRMKEAGMSMDHVRETIKDKIKAALAPSKFKTLETTLTETAMGNAIVIEVRVGNYAPQRYRVTVRREK